jgi:hypothetical protein
MTKRLIRSFRTAAAAVAIATALPALGMALSTSAYAQTQNVVVENFTAGGVTIGKIEIQGTNVSQDDVNKLLSGQMDSAAAQALAKTFTAQSISIDKLDFAAPDGGSFSMEGTAGSDVSAGKVGSLTVGKVTFKDMAMEGGKANMAFEAFELKGLDAASLVEALETGKDPMTAIAEGKMPKFERLAFGKTTIAAPAKDVPGAPEGSVVDIAVGSMEINQTAFAGNVPTASDFAIKNVVVKLPEGSEPQTQLKAFGYDEVDVSLSGKGTWNKDSKEYDLNDLALQMANGATLTIDTKLGNVDEAFFSGDPNTSMMAMLGAGVTNATVSLTNEGLAEKALAFAGQMQGQDAEAMKQQAASVAQMMLPAVLGTDAGAQAIITAVSEFVNNPKNITISAKAKSGMLTAQDFAAVQQPADIFAKIDVEAKANQ